MTDLYDPASNPDGLGGPKRDRFSGTAYTYASARFTIDRCGAAARSAASSNAMC